MTKLGNIFKNTFSFFITLTFLQKTSLSIQVETLQNHSSADRSKKTSGWGWGRFDLPKSDVQPVLSITNSLLMETKKQMKLSYCVRDSKYVAHHS